MPVEPGLSEELVLTVHESDTARSSGGETLPPVLSTPRLIGMLERTAHQAVLSHLAEGQTTVGSLVNVRHIGPTPVGFTVRFRAELLEVEGRRLRFKVEAYDDVEKVAEGEHERFIIDAARFSDRLEKKRALSTGSQPAK